MNLQHFTAWLTIDAGCLDQSNADVMILEDMAITASGPDGTIQEGDWACDAGKSRVFYAITSQDAKEGDMDKAMEEAESLMSQAGWSTVGKWQAADNAYTITVEQAA